MGYLQLASAFGSAPGTGEAATSLGSLLLLLAVLVCCYALAVVIRAPSVDTIRRHADSQQAEREHARR